MIELLNDEEAFIRIEAIEIATDLLRRFSKEQLENDFIPVIISTIEIN